MAAINRLHALVKGEQDEDVGTGSGFGRAVLICAGVSSLVAIILTVLLVLVQTKNYRKPLLQRHVIRIFVLVPIFATASWASLTSLRAAFWIDPFRDVYEAFTLYTFFQLLVNFLGGERSLIILMHGRAPVPHLWPLDMCLAKVDISDPHTFLSVKRGILQYVWIKPALAFATVIMKATGTFREGVMAVDSGYLWTSIIYNVSICISLYDLALFWVCMSADLKPFRPMPKFLCIKGIIFASWWQGFLLSVFVWLGAIQNIGNGYTADNLAAAIQDALICFEMPLFTIAYWYAFSWKDYADKTISDARMPMRYAFRDAFGPRDLIEDAKETWRGDKYEYRYFDAEDNVIAHEQSASRQARMAEGMRYERGGRGKYWIPASGGDKQPLLSRFADSHARTMSPGDGHRSRSRGAGKLVDQVNKDYGTTDPTPEPELDEDEEKLYQKARGLEFGDWNYPVINTHYATREDRLHADPNMISATTNRAILQPGKENRQRRKSRIKEIQSHVHQHDTPSDGESSDSQNKTKLNSNTTLGKAANKISSLVRQPSSSGESSKSHSSQLVDLVVEDKQAEEIERVRARKEGGPGWNQTEQKHFVQTFPGQDEEVEEVKRGFNPDRTEGKVEDGNHNLDNPFTVDDDEDEDGVDETGRKQPWEERRYGGVNGKGKGKAVNGKHEDNPWSS
ncbi:hypothetical protein B0A48_07815 [Cryoendolithus antarcticus]|uniref:DUF300-domain-containing protein n=1 Tax=Cryoendolithus antarcticus TaxID=1507870 RepID=A0A1V8T764_9PEZI|nr:hypothetical protein B0A48_07815 [Cryoendolithus antarcticus]